MNLNLNNVCLNREHARESNINIWILDGCDLEVDKDGRLRAEGVKEIQELFNTNKHILLFVNKVDLIDDKFKEFSKVNING